MTKQLKCNLRFINFSKNNNKTLKDTQIIEKNIYEKNIEQPIVHPNEILNRTSLFFRVHVAGIIESASVINYIKFSSMMETPFIVNMTL